MRHGLKQKKLNRTSSHRKALLKNLAVSLITHEQIITTLPKAKTLRPYVEKLITLGKKAGFQSKRTLLSRLGNNVAIMKKLCETLATRYNQRQGGYTRIIKAGFRFGDAAPIAVIELVDRDINAKGNNINDEVALDNSSLSIKQGSKIEQQSSVDSATATQESKKKTSKAVRSDGEKPGKVKADSAVKMRGKSLGADKAKSNVPRKTQGK